jgi:DNA-binding Lrp family transcriptional regulator
MKWNEPIWDMLDYAIVQIVEQNPGTTIPTVMRAIGPTIPEGTIRNRVRRLAAHGVIRTDRVLGRYYVLHPGAGLEAV